MSLSVPLSGRDFYFNNYTKVANYNYEQPALVADRYLIEGGFCLNADGTLNTSTIITLPPPTTNNMYPVFSQAAAKRVSVFPVIIFASGVTAAQINTVMSNSTYAANSYASIVTVVKLILSCGVMCGGVTLDFETSTNVWIANCVSTWLPGLKSYLKSQGLGYAVSQYISVNYDTSIPAATWRAAVETADLTLIPSYTGPPSGPGPMDPWGTGTAYNVLTRINNLVANSIGSDLIGKVSYIYPFYCDNAICASSTPMSPNLLTKGTTISSEYSTIISAASSPGAVVSQCTEYACICVAVPVTQAQLNTMISAGQLPTGTTLPMWTVYYYNDLPTLQNRISYMQTAAGGGWLNVALFAAGYEGLNPSFLTAFYAFPSGKNYIDDLTNALSARMGIGGGAASGANDLWVLSSNALTQYNLTLPNTPSGGFSPIFQINPPSGPIELTIDNAGNVYILSVGANGLNVITQISSRGNTLLTGKLSVSHIDYDIVKNVLFATNVLTVYTVNVSSTGFSIVAGASIFLDGTTQVGKFRSTGGVFMVIDSGYNNYPMILYTSGLPSGQTMSGCSYIACWRCFPMIPAKDAALTTTEMYMASSSGPVNIYNYGIASNNASYLNIVAVLDTQTPPSSQLIDSRGGQWALVNVTSGTVTTAPDV